MALVDKRLPAHLDTELVIACYEELVVECAEEQTEKIALFVEERVPAGSILARFLDRDA